MEIKCNFDFSKCPELKGMYEKYYKLRLEVVKWSMKDGDTANKRFEKADKMLKDYAYDSFAQAIYNEFVENKPFLYNEDEDGTRYQWDDVFNAPFENLDINMRKCLVGLINGNFVYRLPHNYYKN